MSSGMQPGIVVRMVVNGAYTGPTWPKMLGRMLIAGTAGVTVASLPAPFDLAGVTIVTLLIGWAVWSMRRRPCAICGRRDSFPVPIDLRIPYKPRAWWDLRPPSNKNWTWKCPDHFLVPLPD